MVRVSGWGNFERRDWALISLAVALCVWIVFYPLPYVPCLLLVGMAILVALALPWLSGSGFCVQNKEGMLGSAGQATLFMSLALATRALRDIGMIDWKGPLLLAGGCGLIFAATALAADMSATRTLSARNVVGIAVSFILAGGGFGVGASLEANMLLDTSTPTNHVVRVTDKWISRGRTTRRHFRLAVPNDLDLDDIYVDDPLYTRVSIGQFVCIHEHSGALGFRWYLIDACAPVQIS